MSEEKAVVKEKISVMEKEINKDLEGENPQSLMIELLEKIEKNTRAK